MKAVIGYGCIGSGIKEKPENVRAYINAFLDQEEKTQGDLDIFLYNLVETYGTTTYSDSEPCEQCGDYYYEYTLEIEDKDVK